jgi:type II secretory pathway pseudopilin PulG
MAIKLPRLIGSPELVDENRRPTLTFTRYWQSFAEQIEFVINKIAEILGITDQLDEAVRQNAEAAKEAKEAAQAAREAADAAAEQTAATKREAALQGSYIDPASVLTASPTTITIAAHTRYYADGTSVAVNGGTRPVTASGDTDYVSYVDAARTGGTVTYTISTTPPVQTGDTHVVGAVMIPTTGTTDGGEGPRRPGYVVAKQGNTVEP